MFKLTTRLLDYQTKDHPTKLWKWLLAGLLVGLSLTIAFARFSNPFLSPSQVALAYARAVYSRDYDRAWEFISAEDAQYKSREQYLSQNVSYLGLQQELAYTLAGWIQFEEVNLQIDGVHAVVTVRVKAPNGNQPEVYEILQSARRETELAAEEHEALIERLEAIYAAGQIEILEGGHTFDLVREWSGWRIRMGLGEAILVRLTAEVSPDLPWDFYPLQPDVRAFPGEALKVTYRAVNRSDRAITAKGKHFILPEEHEKYFTTLQCFCFIQQTLKPGEAQDMTLVFRIDYDVPANVREFENHYIFYPIESFPED